MLTFSLTFKAKFGSLDIVLPLQEFNNRKPNGSYKHTLTYADTIIHTHTFKKEGYRPQDVLFFSVLAA